jgi:hypothetical protein
VQKVFPLLGLVVLISCGHGNQDKEAVRKAVQDRLAGMGMPAATINVQLNSVDFKGDSAVADVAIVPKSNAGAGMSMKYQLQYKDNKWAVTGRADAKDGHGAQPPAGGAMPASPHGGGMSPGAGAMPGGDSPMPSPNDLPPAKKKSGKEQ